MKTERHARFGCWVVALALAFSTGCSRFSKRSQPAVSDTVIKSQIENALNRDPLVEGAQVSVQSVNGIVELTGKTKSSAVKSRAGLIAASTPGVVQVHNDLLISPSTR
ncbi:MAG TPA: BON domain-containing protein [Candidatus Limnocylindrales bacterium]|jgi:osmotically-inducible protein OsmY|nr:BON domain-containing protein [Candidatus Limnocylindrales bacterium]